MCFRSVGNSGNVAALGACCAVAKSLWAKNLLFADGAPVHAHPAELVAHEVKQRKVQ
jgi:hypothetical protein